MSYCISSNAEKLATNMHRLAQWSKAHPNSEVHTLGIIKLPPVFTTDKNGHRNLVAMIKTLAEYETTDSLTLSDLPSRYNSNGGLPKLQEKDMRKVHNWLQQVSFGIRAAIVDNHVQTRTANVNKHQIAELVAKDLYGDNDKRIFVTYSLGNKYELKPMRRANLAVKTRWISEEVGQRIDWDANSIYGAKPHQLEWDIYGLKGHTKTVVAELQAEIHKIIRQAQTLDIQGRFEEADELDDVATQMSQSLDSLAKLDSVR